MRCTSTASDPFLFLDGLEPSLRSRSARDLPSSRACRRSRAVKAPPPPLGKFSSLEVLPRRQPLTTSSPPSPRAHLYNTIGVND